MRIQPSTPALHQNSDFAAKVASLKKHLLYGIDQTHVPKQKGQRQELMKQVKGRLRSIESGQRDQTTLRYTDAQITSAERQAKQMLKRYLKKLEG